jgi:hypothetical protein
MLPLSSPEIINNRILGAGSLQAGKLNRVGGKILHACENGDPVEF